MLDSGHRPQIDRKFFTTEADLRAYYARIDAREDAKATMRKAGPPHDPAPGAAWFISDAGSNPEWKQRPPPRSGFRWFYCAKCLKDGRQPWRWYERPEPLEGDELLQAIVTLRPIDEDTIERLLHTFKNFNVVSGEIRETLIWELAEALGESIDDAKARIRMYDDYTRWVE